MAQDMNTPETCLLGLSRELISQIFLRLSVQDASSFRLTCHSIEFASFSAFGREYFSRKRFMFRTSDLERLVNIAEDARLSKYLHDIRFITLFFSDRALESWHVGVDWQPSPQQAADGRRLIADQRQLKKSGSDHALLTRAFQLLPAVRSVVFADFHQPLPDTATDVLSCDLLSRKTGIASLSEPEGPNDKAFFAFQDHFFRAIVRALAKSPHTTLTSFNTSLGIGNGLSAVHSLDFDPRMKDNFRNILSNLTEFEVQLGANARRPLELQGDNDAAARTLGAALLRDWGDVLPAIQRLRAAFSLSTNLGPHYKALIGGIKLNNLSILSLSEVCIGATSLNQTIVRIPRVRELYLTGIDLVEGSWIDVLRAVQRFCKEVDHLHLSGLREGGGRAAFLPELDLSGFVAPSSPLPSGWSYPQGPATGGWDADVGVPPSDPVDTGSSSSSTTAGLASPSPPLRSSQEAAATILAAQRRAPLADGETTPAESDCYADRNADVLFLLTYYGMHNCLRGRQIAAQLPFFIEEYRVMDSNFISFPPAAVPFVNHLIESYGTLIYFSPDPNAPPPFPVVATDATATATATTNPAPVPNMPANPLPLNPLMNLHGHGQAPDQDGWVGGPDTREEREFWEADEDEQDETSPSLAG